MSWTEFRLPAYAEPVQASMGTPAVAEPAVAEMGVPSVENATADNTAAEVEDTPDAFTSLPSTSDGGQDMSSDKFSGQDMSSDKPSEREDHDPNVATTAAVAAAGSTEEKNEYDGDSSAVAGGSGHGEDDEIPPLVTDDESPRLHFERSFYVFRGQPLKEDEYCPYCKKRGHNVFTCREVTLGWAKTNQWAFKWCSNCCTGCHWTRYCPTESRRQHGNAVCRPWQPSTLSRFASAVAAGETTTETQPAEEEESGGNTDILVAPVQAEESAGNTDIPEASTTDDCEAKDV